MIKNPHYKRTVICWLSAALTLSLLLLINALPSQASQGAGFAAEEAGQLFTQVVTSTVTGPVFLPAVQTAPQVPEQKTVFICSPSGSPIPDNDVAGVLNNMALAEDWYIADLDVYLEVVHPHTGDVSAWLVHQDTGTTAGLFDRPGRSSSGTGCSADNIQAIFDDQASISAEDKCGGNPGIGGSFLPYHPLDRFRNEKLTGTWSLLVNDEAAGDSGFLDEWCLEVTLSNVPVEPPVPPVYPSLPESVSLNVPGQDQNMPLDCESRSAVDWAAFFGYSIGEFEFFNRLPNFSDNADVSFVGNVWGEWGQIPPNAYGVHAAPIASVLHSYGVNAAEAVRQLSWDGLRAELAAGQPVEVWIIGNMWSGAPVYYTSSDGHRTVVAHNEHTVIVTGYDSTKVWYRNGDTLYSVPIDQFLYSWGVLRNMAVIWQDGG